MKNGNNKTLFKNLNEHSKDLYSKQYKLSQEHDALLERYEELKHLKNNMDEYMKKEDAPRKSTIRQIEKVRNEQSNYGVKQKKRDLER